MTFMWHYSQSEVVLTDSKNNNLELVLVKSFWHALKIAIGENFINTNINMLSVFQK